MNVNVSIQTTMGVSLRTQSLRERLFVNLEFKKRVLCEPKVYGAVGNLHIFGCCGGE